MEIETQSTSYSPFSSEIHEDGKGEYILQRTRVIKMIEACINKYNLALICSPSFTGKTSLVICLFEF